VTATESTRRSRRELGAWATPDELVGLVVGGVVDAAWVAGGHVRIVDPACGDGRFLAAAADAVDAAGGRATLVGIDLDEAALACASARLAGRPVDLRHADALDTPWADGRFDLVVGNPPFLSQLARGTTRGGASRHGGGPSADAAAEFLALAVRAVRPGGRIGLVLPQSVLASRDVAPVRVEVDAVTDRIWSWWSPRRWFDAEVVVCALGFERRWSPRRGAVGTGRWADVVTDAIGLPSTPPIDAAGTLGDRARAGANFRDEYYGLVDAVADDVDGPPLVTTGLIDPGVCHWGARPVRFARRVHQAPRVDLGRLDDRMRSWATAKLVPKVLVATPTRVVEAVADVDGAWLPGVPVVTVVPHDGDALTVAAVLTSPLAALHVWARAAGTGLSATTVRIRAADLADLAWPAGDLTDAVEHLRAGDVDACGTAVARAAGWADDDPAISWWRAARPGATAGAPAPTRVNPRSSRAATTRSAR
jgi:SAM-dependent methyltransferase